MEDNKELVLENNTENVDELTTEELVDGDVVTNEIEESVEENTAKTYTDEEVDEIVKKKLYRKENKIRDEYEKKYAKVEELLKAGLETNTFEEAVDNLESFYKEKGINVETPKYSQREEELLAEAEANDIISNGMDEMVEEVDRLAKLINSGKATNKDKKIFTKVAEERKRQEGIKELASIGVKQEAIERQDFKDFEKKLNPKMSLKEKYEMYLEFQPKPKVETIGSMKDGTSSNDEIKSFYTYEEASKFTREDLDKNPKLVEAIENSMQKWN